MAKRPLTRALVSLAKHAARGFIKGMAPHVARALEAQARRRPKIDSASERRADQQAAKQEGGQS
jgi:hypothetical protein